jgi:tetratricopeptide (TPR) repeat protein
MPYQSRSSSAKARWARLFGHANPASRIACAHFFQARLIFSPQVAAVFSFSLLTVVVAQPGAAQESRVIQLNTQAVQLYHQGKFLEGIPVAREALQVAEATYGPEHAKVANELNNLGLLYQAQGQYAAAEPVYQRALRIREKTLGPEHPAVAVAVNNLAGLYEAQGRYGEAEPLYKRALTIWEKALGPEHPAVASALNNLAGLYQDQGQYAAAEPLFKRSLAIREKLSGPEHPDVALSLNNLALIYEDQGQYAAAEPLYKRALRIREKALGPEHPDVALSLNNLAGLYQAQGQYDEAEPLYQRALTIWEKALGPEHPLVATALDNLAVLSIEQRQYATAEALEKRALAIREKALGLEHPAVAKSLNTLAEIYQDQGQYAAAEPLFKRALEIREKALGPEHPDVADSLTHLARLYQDQGQYGAAEPLYRRALAIQEKALGPDHPDNQATLENLALLYYGWGRPRDAEAVFDRAFQNLGKQFEQQFSYMSEKERLAFLTTVSGVFPAYFSFVLTYKDQEPELVAKMYDRLLWEKGMVAGSVAAERARLAVSGDQQALALFDQMAAKKTQRAALVNTAPRDREQWRRNLAQLEQEANDLEKQLVQHSVSFAEEKELARPSWDRVRAALKEDEAAVEFVRFGFHNGKKWSMKFDYAALVVRRQSTQPQLVALGDAKDLEGAPLEDYRAWVAEPNAAEPRGPDAGRKFAERFWQPLEGALGDARRIYVSPDGVLDQVALGVVPRGDGKLLMETYDLRLVSSTKDLLPPAQRPAANTAVLVGNPAFDLSVAQQQAALSFLEKLGKEKAEPVMAASVVSPSAFWSGQQSHNPRGQLRSEDCPGLPPGDTLCPLQGTQREVEAIFADLKSRHWDVAAPYTQERALKEVVERVKHPRVLHLATHGFFPPQRERIPSQLGGGRLSELDDPMLQSKLFFAGAERALREEAPVEGLQDGVLTAYEASTLDLQGTELVVLSACGTGLGEIQAFQSGEGVFGLRRALQEAGAQSVLMSLWSVPDAETRELMTRFYANWLGGKDKPRALQEAQQQLRQQVKKHYGRDLPFYWGAFVLVGR